MLEEEETSSYTYSEACKHYYNKLENAGHYRCQKLSYSDVTWRKYFRCPPTVNFLLRAVHKSFQYVELAIAVHVAIA